MPQKDKKWENLKRRCLSCIVLKHTLAVFVSQVHAATENSTEVDVLTEERDLVILGHGAVHCAVDCLCVVCGGVVYSNK